MINFMIVSIFLLSTITFVVTAAGLILDPDKTIDIYKKYVIPYIPATWRIIRGVAIAAYKAVGVFGSEVSKISLKEEAPVLPNNTTFRGRGGGM